MWSLLETAWDEEKQASTWHVCLTSCNPLTNRKHTFQGLRRILLSSFDGLFDDAWWWCEALCRIHFNMWTGCCQSYWAWLTSAQAQAKRRWLCPWSSSARKCRPGVQKMAIMILRGLRFPYVGICLISVHLEHLDDWWLPLCFRWESNQQGLNYSVTSSNPHHSTEKMVQTVNIPWDIALKSCHIKCEGLHSQFGAPKRDIGHDQNMVYPIMEPLQSICQCGFLSHGATPSSHQFWSDVPS